jgi:pyruvate kinase
MPQTKVVCTIGPASSSPEMLRALIDSGMNVARLNFSHGSHAEHGEKIRIIREISRTCGKPVAILQDLCGPKIRVGIIPEPGIRLDVGNEVLLTSEPITAAGNRISVSYPALPQEVRPGDRILLADGLMELEVRSAEGTDIVCSVINGGILTSHKGINLPTGTINTPALTEKDRRDLAFGLSCDVDYVAMSFVRNAEDIADAKAQIAEAGKATPVIAKIEKHEAIDNIEAILDRADGIMVARGDLGVEIPLETVPVIQKRLVRQANFKGKPVIIATQMLRSMVESPRPTRAEATDIANAVLDGADAIMLSEETAVGRYPAEAVSYMVRIAKTTESRYPHMKYTELIPRQSLSASVGYTACILAQEIDAAAIVATTRSGATARYVSGFRPRMKIIALSPDERTVRQLALIWGCVPCFQPIGDNTDAMIEDAADAALKTGRVRAGDTVVITAGRPLWAPGTTNMLWVRDL